MAPPPAASRAPIATPALGGFFADGACTAALDVLQDPDRGRKFATKDKRPLDPPPIVRLRIYRQVPDESAPREITDYPPHLIQGCICHVDLLRAPDPPRDAAAPAAAGTRIPVLEEIMRARERAQTPEGADGSVRVSGVRHAVYDGEVDGIIEATAADYDSDPGGAPLALALAPAAAVPPADLPSASDALFGTLVAQVRPVEWQGATVLLFVFGDLAVRLEGTFVLRYTFFDIFSPRPGSQNTHVLAAAHSAPFQVYTTKAFPGLQASTDLTKAVLAHGIPVHIRQEVRKRSRPRRSPAVPSSGGGTLDDEDEDDAEEEDED